MALTKVKLIADDAITSAMIDSTSTGVAFADLTVDTSTLVVDAVNNRVGIGTTSPVRNVSVYGSSSAVMSFHNSTTGTTISDGMFVGNDANLAYVYNYESTPLIFATAATERMRIDSSGNIVLGANGNQYGLVTIRQSGTSNDSGLAVVNSTNTKSARLWTDGTNSYLSSGATGTGVLVLNEGGGNVGIGETSPSSGISTSSSTLHISDSNVASIALDNTTQNTKFDIASLDISGGALSIRKNTSAGTSGATELIRIDSSGNSSFYGTIKSFNTGAAHLILNGDTNNSGDSGEIDAIIDLLGDGNPGLYGYRINTENWSGQTALNFQEYLNGSYTSRLFISKDGNVGIGTTSPSSLLHISKNSSNSQLTLERTGSSTGKFKIYTNTNSLFIYDDGQSSHRMKIDSSGNVGIGTTNPTRNLTIGDGSGNSVLAIVAATNGLSQIGLGDSDDDNYGQIILRHSDGLLQIQNGGGGGITERGLNITSSEDIGIGTTTPDVKLHVVGDGDRLQISSNDYDLIKIGAFGDSGADLDNAFLNLSLNGSEKIRLLANGTSYFNGGNVGIGTTLPGAPLHINKADAETQLIISRSGSNLGTSATIGNIKFQSDYNSNLIDYAYIYASSNNLSGVRGSLNFSVKSTSGSVINGMTLYGSNDGARLGIGTTSPAALLDIHDDSPVLRISATNQSGSWSVGTEIGKLEFYTTDPSGNAPYDTGFIAIENDSAGGTLPSGAMVFGTATYNATGGAVERMRIDSNGNFGFRVGAENSSGTWRNFQIGGGANLVTRGSNANDLLLGTGFYFNTANQELYKNTEAVSRIFFNNDVMTFQNAASGTAGTAITWNERMRILSSGGITFNGDTSTANALDDYEEGTFSTNPVSTNVSNYSWSGANGRYTKIGRQVIVTFFISNITAGTGNRYFVLSNFPFVQHTAAHDETGYCNNYPEGQRRSGIVINNSGGNNDQWYVSWYNNSAQSTDTIRATVIYTTT